MAKRRDNRVKALVRASSGFSQSIDELNIHKVAGFKPMKLSGQPGEVGSGMPRTPRAGLSSSASEAGGKLRRSPSGVNDESSRSPSGEPSRVLGGRTAAHEYGSLANTNKVRCGYHHRWWAKAVWDAEPLPTKRNA